MTVTVEDGVPTFPVDILGPDEQQRPLSIGEALTLVMNEVQAIRKAGTYDDNRGTRYNFRGIDDVVNAVGPVLRKYGIRVIPRLLNRTLRDTKTGAGRDTREVLVEVEYTLKAPDGSLEVYVVPGESLDTSDKGTAKAMSVAYRILWLQALCIPTDDPDPDASHLERTGTGPMPAALESHIMRIAQAPGAFDPTGPEPVARRWYAAVSELHHAWTLVQAYSAAELGIPGEKAHPTATWHGFFAFRYKTEVDRCQTIDQLRTLWEALGPEGRTKFRTGGATVESLIKARTKFIETRCADNLNSIKRQTEAATSPGELHEVRRALMAADGAGHVFGPGLEAAYAALEEREQAFNARLIEQYGTGGTGDYLHAAYANLLEQVTDPGLIPGLQADIRDNIGLAENEEAELLDTLDKRAIWLRAEMEGPDGTS
jgi:hypothetical protein